MSVELVTATPDGDLLVVNAARCSFDKQKDVLDDKDIKLLNYLAKHKHLLPFRHPHVTLRVTMPIFVARQLGKHQVGMSMSEVSRRYVKSEPDFYEFEDLRPAAENVKQGSANETHTNSDKLLESVRLVELFGLDTYSSLIEEGVCAEQARAVLPQSMMTTVVWTGSMLSWFQLYKQRTESHTQKETREYAFKIGEILVDIYPNSWEALCTHCL